jgi:hypothetical protein
LARRKKDVKENPFSFAWKGGGKGGGGKGGGKGGGGKGKGEKAGVELELSGFGAGSTGSELIRGMEGLRSKNAGKGISPAFGQQAININKKCPPSSSLGGSGGKGGKGGKGGWVGSCGGGGGGSDSGSRSALSGSSSRESGWVIGSDCGRGSGSALGGGSDGGCGGSCRGVRHSIRVGRAHGALERCRDARIRARALHPEHAAERGGCGV